MQECPDSGSLRFSKWDIGVVGKTVDDRGTVATDFVQQHAARTMLTEYDSGEFKLEIDGVKYAADNIAEALREWQNKAIILEATTCGFVELFLILHGLAAAGSKGVTFLYVEPGEYTHSRRTPLLHRRDFELSEEVPGYRGIPNAAIVMTDLAKQRAVFFLGYEERRLDRALEGFQMLRPDN